MFNHVSISPLSDDSFFFGISLNFAIKFLNSDVYDRVEMLAVGGVR
jgi:hypothetical protein